MNDIAKENISTRLVKALEVEQLTPGNAAKIFKINPNYISMIKNQESWKKCPASGWEAVLLWINSGEKLRDYANINGIDLNAKTERRANNIRITRPEKSVKINVLEPCLTQTDNQKVVIDIEINIVINGKKISL